MSVHDELYEKMSAELERFEDGLRSKPPDEIIGKAYELIFKTELLAFFERDDIVDEAGALAMLALDAPLQKLYDGWLDEDSSYLDHLRDSIESTVENLPQPPEHGVSETAVTDTQPATAKTLYGEVGRGDWVIAAGGDEHRYLLGMVTAVDKHGTPEHCTENETDDVHVDFTAFEYPPDRIEEIEEHFSGLYGELKTFDEIPLDDVIMAPDMLIGITHLGYDEIRFMGNLRQNCESFCNSVTDGSYSPQSDKHGELMARLAVNLKDYHESLMGFGKRELIDMAGKIAAMSAAHSHMCYCGFDDGELDFYLQFQNPLEVVADALLERNSDPGDDLSFVMYDLFDKRAALADYPLMSDFKAHPSLGLRRYMGVDLIDFLGKIAAKVIVHYPNDWKIDINSLYRRAGSDDPDDKRLMWHVSSWGTHLNTERETFIRDTGAYNAWVHYHPNDPDMFGYAVEITGKDGQRVIGNVFEVGNYAEHAKYVRETALVLDAVSLTYSDAWGVNAGKTITVPRYEYDNDRHRLCSESGNVVAMRYYPSESLREMSDILHKERSRRMSYPLGSMEAHLHKLAGQLAEIRKPIELPPHGQAARLSASKAKPSIMERLAEADAEAKAYNAQKAQDPINITKNKKKEIY